MLLEIFPTINVNMEDPVPQSGKSNKSIALTLGKGINFKEMKEEI